MGFDNECILNIQSLAGEYFCPVCRLLVYPNEALQSQCTHLYCKPCLTYVVNTTQACPYDGYLVTEADSKPLTERNKSLAETIGKTPVHCLYHRSGCTWQGSLSACVSHCPGCAFGNSPVVCNRCGVQIVHRQVQEHALSCPGAAAQAQAGVAAATSAAADQTQSSAAASQAAAAAAAAVEVPGKEANQQSSSSSQQAQAVAQASTPTAEQWYHQQQQQYQQYYQQYPGYDQYQQQYQQYYPYQQQQVPPVPASLAQPQASHLQALAANQPQNQVQLVHPVIAQQTYPQAHPHSHLQVQQQIQPNKTPNANTQSQPQNPAALAMTGHPLYPQTNTEPHQYLVHSQSQLASTHQTPSPVQALAQFPQQPQQMRLLHSHVTVSNQQQQVLFPPSGQVRNVPPGQQTVQQPYFQQPGLVPPVQLTFPQQSLQHQPLRPLGQPRLFPPPMQSVASSHGAQHANLSTPVGRPSMPSHGVQSQLYSQFVGGLPRPGFPGTYQQSADQDNVLKTPKVQLPTEQQFGVNSKPTVSAKIDLEPKPAVVGNTVAEIQTENSGSDMKPVGSENKVSNEGTKEYKHMQGKENGVPVMKEGGVEGTLNHSYIGESREVVTADKKDVLEEGSEKIKQLTTTVEEKKTANGSQHINPPFQAHGQREEHGGNLVKDSIHGSDNGSQEAPIASAQMHDGFTEPPPPPTLDQGRHQPLPSHYGPMTLPPRPAAPSLEPPHQTSQPTHFGPRVPGHPSGTSFARGHAQYNSMHSGAIGQLPPPPAFDSHGGTIARPTTYGPDMFPTQRPFSMDGRQLDPNFPGPLEHGKLVPNMKSMNSFDSALPIGPRDERLLLHAEQFNSFPAALSRHMPDRMEFLDDMKQFPRPFDRGPHGLRYDPGLKMEPGGVLSRFLRPYDVGTSSYSGKRLGLRREDPLVRMEPSRGHLDFFGQGPARGRRHMDSLASRSPGREHLGMSWCGFRGPDSDDIHGRELRRFGEPFPGPFPESRFSMLPSHLLRGEFEGPGRMGVGDHLRNDITGHIQGRERIGNVYDDLHLREQVGFGTRPHHARMTDIVGPAMDPFRGGDRPHYPHLDEPGFRSKFSLHGLPNDSGIITGESSFDISRKRKPPTMGWCRICKVDCETVEGLELHSQTREHQKMAMDIVAAIKQNAKRKKIASGDQSSPRDASKSRNSGSEDHGKKN